MSGLGSTGSTDSRIFGVVVGIVTNNQDPDKLGRIKVRIPRLSEEDESNWARVTTFMSGQEWGAFYLPQVEDEVLVMFESGDINRPYVIGSLWNGTDKPPSTNEEKDNNLRLIKSRSGHTILLDDTEDASKIEITSSSGQVIRLDDTKDKEKIDIIDKTTKNMITFDAANNLITISSDLDIMLKAPKGTITLDGDELLLKSKGAITVEAGGDLGLTASGDLNAEGSAVNLN